MKTINVDIGQVLGKAKAGHYLIPQFQREFTWKPKNTKLLIDSIARNYPIGSFLVLGKTNDSGIRHFSYSELEIDFEKVGTLSGEETPSNSGELYYVLDGQQRLTSLARVFLNADKQRTYYFDLAYIYRSFEDGDDCWIQYNKRGKSNPPAKKDGRLLRSDIAFDQEKCDIRVAQYFEDTSGFPEFNNDRGKAREASAKVRGIFEKIRKFTIPLVELDRNAPLESICRIFETINSTGMRLSTFDLAVARYFPEPDLRKEFEAVKEKHSIIKNYKIEAEKFLQILSLLSYREVEKSRPTKQEELYYH